MYLLFIMDHSIQMKYACLAFSYMPYEHTFTIIISWSLSELTWTWHIAVADIKKVSRNLPVCKKQYIYYPIIDFENEDGDENDNETSQESDLYAWLEAHSGLSHSYITTFALDWARLWHRTLRLM